MLVIHASLIDSSAQIQSANKLRLAKPEGGRNCTVLNSRCCPEQPQEARNNFPSFAFVSHLLTPICGYLGHSLGCFLTFLHLSHQLACSFQVCRVQSPQRLVTWEHLGKVCGMNAGGGGRRQATALCYVITPPLRNLVVLSISTKSLALSSCCPPCMSLQHARRPAKGVESIRGSWEQHTSYHQRTVVWGCLCCSSLPTAMVPEQQRCFSGLHIYFNLNSCVCVRRFPCFSWEAFIGQC